MRAKLPKGHSAVLRAVELFYLPQNQRARVSDVQGTRPPPKRGEPARQPLPPTTLLNLNWKVTKPDSDTLRYRIDYREEGQMTWREMFGEDTNLTDAIEASDELSNPDRLTLRSSAVSEPIRVDNHPPRIEHLKVRRGRVQGRVVDDMGPVARIQLSIDATPWRDVFPTDSLLDSRSEGFDLPVGDLPRGAHIVAVRAFDASGNQANREITVKTGR
ncbi:MAG: hypothetical protein JRE82_17540 [Deltaproteobacteria bacterium]|nr:hypothetical protein [Deltaproteobacteria bacterium]